ncbi:hypothetical protein BC826DRAFT_1028100 [Russula brevipes]|nr:hypothetical protein BC826DRAFT_1028100 [Russula brevipes]
MLAMRADHRNRSRIPSRSLVNSNISGDLFGRTVAYSVVSSMPSKMNVFVSTDILVSRAMVIERMYAPTRAAKGKAKRNEEHTAELGVCRPNELMLELSTTRRLYQGVQSARRVYLGHRLVVDGLWQRAWERLKESLQGHRVVFLGMKEPTLGRNGLPIPKLDKIQDALDDRVRGTRSLGRLEREVSHVYRKDAEQIQ